MIYSIEVTQQARIVINEHAFRFARSLARKWVYQDNQNAITSVHTPGNSRDPLCAVLFGFRFRFQAASY